MNKKKNSTEIYGEGYISGYNQHRVDTGEISQKEADKILRKVNRKEVLIMAKSKDKPKKDTKKKKV